MKSQIKTLNQLIETFNKRLQIIYSNREAHNIAQQAIMHLFEFRNKVDLIIGQQNDVLEKEVENALIFLTELEKGRPLQHLIGKVQFADLDLKVNEHVLIPRPETEELVYLIKEFYSTDFSGTIIDIGTGSGCILMAMKSFFNNAKVIGVDISEKALETAQENAQINNLEVDFLKYDILNFKPKKIQKRHPELDSGSTLDDAYLNQIPNQFWNDGKLIRQYFEERGFFDIIISNPPYIPIDEKDLMHKNVADYEPSIALFTPNNDPLLFYRSILDWSQKHLSKDGKVFFELHENYAEQTLELALNFYSNSELKEDMQGKQRFLVCTKTS
ncbi:MAG: peptide chain release factor N(5)-glutamine methyltransferase [Bacteroidia bacterium]